MDASAIEGLDGAYSDRVRTRYAPTPSGYLHIGNAAHLVTVQRIAQRFEADALLRIDDADISRARSAYLEDIFNLLRWLDVDWELGPRSPADMPVWSQHTRFASYRRALDALIDAGRAYPCECSRAAWLDYNGSDCPGGCRERNLKPEVGWSSWRLHLSGFADPVIWRRDDVPAYHLSSVVDDDTWSVDLIVRGSDLREATSIQRRISELLVHSTFVNATVLHHDVIAGDNGVKLSKSAGHQARPLERTPETKARILELAEQLEASAMADLPRSSEN